ncbi:hypothetical protein ACX80Z_11675 [Arthrobacter sp. TMT4-20]
MAPACALAVSAALRRRDHLPPIGVGTIFLTYHPRTIPAPDAVVRADARMSQPRQTYSTGSAAGRTQRWRTQRQEGIDSAPRPIGMP